MNFRRLTVMLVGVWLARPLRAQAPISRAAGAMSLDRKWLLAPVSRPAGGFESAGVKAVFIDGPQWHGKPTRFFAWYGLPSDAAGKKVPGMVLVHGGGGTAFANWVRLWTRRGYAAIAMDTCGQVPRRRAGHWERDAMGGPPGWGGFDSVDELISDHWTYHAVADVVIAHSFLRSLPQVDSSRVGLTGISWGGYLTCIVSGLDTRFRFAAPVYGCGFLGDDSAWLKDLARMGPEKSRRWLECWDPSVYLPKAAMPTLWVDGTNDLNYPMDLLQKSYRLPGGPHTLVLRVRMRHAHGPGEAPEEIHAYADQFLLGKAPLAQVTGQGRHGGRAWVSFDSAVPVKEAELNFTRNVGPWPRRKWESVNAAVERGKATANIPGGTTVFYFNLIDDRGLIVSSEHVELAR